MAEIDLPSDQEEPRRRPVGAESTPGGVGSPLGSETLETQHLPALDALLQTNFDELQLPPIKGRVPPHVESHEVLGDDRLMAVGELFFLNAFSSTYFEFGPPDDTDGAATQFSLTATLGELSFGVSKARRILGKEKSSIPDAAIWDPVLIALHYMVMSAAEPDMDTVGTNRLKLYHHDIIDVRNLTFVDTDESQTDVGLRMRGGVSGGGILEVIQPLISQGYTNPTYRRLRLADPTSADDATTKRYVDGLSYAGHTLLDGSLHTDTLAGSVVDGDVLIGNVTPEWSRLAISVPAANVRNVLGIDNGETRPSWKTVLDGTDPADLGAAAPGTALIFSHRDHVHAHPSGLGASLHHTKYADADAIAAVEGEATLALSGAVEITGILTVDVINEKTGAAGVTIDGLLLKDGLVDGMNVGAHLNAYNGSFLEPMTFVVDSNGSTITGTLDKDPTGDLTEVFSDGYSTMSSGATVVLTVGSATVPKKNYIYVLQSNKGVLVASDSNWPSAEHIKVAEVVVQTATLVASDGILANRFWNDHAQDTDGQGHHLHTWERLRWEHSAYKSGSAVTWTGSGGAVLDLAITAAQVYQMHLHNIAAFDTTDPDNVYVVNHPTAYTITPDIETLVVDSDNDSLTNRYYNLVIWQSVSSGSEEEKVFVNLPSGSYMKQSDAENDVSGYDDFNIPTDYRGYAYLVQRVTIKHASAGGGTWTIIQETDLRGTVPSIAVGGGTLAITTEFSDNAFKLFDEGDPTKELAFQLSGITAGNVRTVTAPDKDLTLIDAADAIAAVEGEATLDLTGDVTIQDGTASKTLDILVTGEANPKMKLSKDRLEFGPGGAVALDSFLRWGDGGFIFGPNNFVSMEETTEAGVSWDITLVGEPHARLIFTDSEMSWGSGAASQDVKLTRTTANRLDLSGSLRIQDAAASRTLEIAVLAAANPKARLSKDSLEFGAGGASALDVNLYRNAADELKTDDKFIVGAGLDVTGNSNFGAYYLDIDDIAVPADPGAGIRRLFVDTATGELSVRTNAGATISLEAAAGYSDAQAISAVEGEAALALTGDVTVGSNILLENDGFVQLAEIGAPSAPAADKGRLFAAVVEAETELYWRRPSAQAANQPQRISRAFTYDTFKRTVGTDIGDLDSGQAWTEDVGDLEITADEEMGAVSLTGGEAVATFPLGYQENLRVTVDFAARNGANAHVSLLLRYVDNDNYILIQVLGSTIGGGNGKFNVYKKVGGGFTELASRNLSTALSAGAAVTLKATLSGGVIFAECHGTDDPRTYQAHTVVADEDDLWTATLKGGLKMGVRLRNTSDALDSLVVETF